MLGNLGIVSNNVEQGIAVNHKYFSDSLVNGYKGMEISCSLSIFSYKHSSYSLRLKPVEDPEHLDS